MTDKQIKKLNELTEMSQELGLYEDRPDWRITLQADHIKRLEEELQAKEQECEEWQKEVERIQFIGSYGILDEVKKNKELEEQLDQLKACLTEIKEIAKGIAKSTYDSYPYGGDVATWEAQRAKQILQKISEVENG